MSPHTDVADPLADIAALADELTDPHRHRQPYEIWTRSRHRKILHHVTTQPGLLTQLRDQYEPTAAGEPGSNPPDSRPPLNLEAISRHTMITLAATRWCWSLRIDLRDTVESNIRALVGAAGQLDHDDQSALHAELRQWHTWAAVLTGWQTPPYRPHTATCPACAARGSLTIRLDTQRAYCRHVDCGATWDPTTIGLLADHIRRTTEEGTAA